MLLTDTLYATQMYFKCTLFSLCRRIHTIKSLSRKDNPIGRSFHLLIETADQTLVVPRLAQAKELDVN